MQIAKLFLAGGVSLLILAGAGCKAGAVPELSHSSGELRRGQRVPNEREEDAIGSSSTRIGRSARGFRSLMRYDGPTVVFKDEERTGADRMMTPRLAKHLSRLARLVSGEWPGVYLRITEAWDEQREHGSRSAHYEGRAADLTTSDLDAGKLGRLGYLAVQAEFDWVYYENQRHIHVSVKH
ncbi:MAG TPA: hypothetical protein VG963_13485 [Polyangiaceae bacterium]|nr:hypothetical protein [Polyangiaceae bacterium]